MTIPPALPLRPASRTRYGVLRAAIKILHFDIVCLGHCPHNISPCSDITNSEHLHTQPNAVLSNPELLR